MRSVTMTWLCVTALVAPGLSCTPQPENDEGPTPPDAGFRVNAGLDIDAGEGDEVLLKASAQGGRAPYHFRWSIERSPTGADDLSLSDETIAEVRTSALTLQGRYVFRVVLMDSAGHDAYDSVTVNVGPPGTGQIQPIEIRIEGPDRLEPDEEGTLRAITDADTNGLTFLWEAVTDHEVVFNTPDQPTTTFTVNQAGTIVVRVTVADDEADAAGSAEFTVEVAIEGALAVSVEGPESVEVNQTIQVTATPENNAGDVTFAWTVTDGEADLTDAETATVSIRPTALGRLAVEVEISDPDTEQTATAQYVVTVNASTSPLTLQAAGPDILRTGEAGPLSVQIEGEDELDDIQHTWQVVSGDATLDDPSAAEPNLISSSGETVEVRVTVTGTQNGETRSGTADVFVVTYAEDRPEVLFTIPDFGEFVFELRPDVSPKTVANFLRYVDDGFYDGLVIHRVVAEFVIQGGGFEVDENGELQKVETRDPVPGEAPNGLSNIRGTVAMALIGGDADSGTSQWFVNLVDNTADGMVDLDAQSFTVFASVSEGMDVVDAISEAEFESRSGLDNVPVDDIIIQSAARRPAPP